MNQFPYEVLTAQPEGLVLVEDKPADSFTYVLGRMYDPVGTDELRYHWT